MSVTIAATVEPCEICAIPTKVRIAGAPGHHGCFQRAAANLASDNDAAAAGTAAGDVPLRFLRDLETTYAPKRKIDGRMHGPWWRPPIPPVMDLVQVSGWGWRTRRPFRGSAAVLDRTASWITSASSVEVAHGALEQAGDAPFTGLPGIYKVPVFPWTETELPHPLGGAAMAAARGDDAAVWIPHTRLALLEQLARAGRYPETTPLDSYVCQISVRLDKWASHVQTVRETAIRKHGRGSEYDAVKVNYSQAVALMKGSREAGQARRWKCQTHRTDWALSIEDHAAVSLWRAADEAREVVTRMKRPELAPVAMRAVDELLVPVDAIDILTTVPRSGNRAPMKIDREGIKLGTFKVKGIEEIG